MGSRHAALLTALQLASVGCHPVRPVAVPGDTEVAVEAVRIRPVAGERLTVDQAPLLENLGLRPGTLIRPERRFNPFRLAEDRRRILSYLQMFGWFDAAVSEPVLERSADGRRVSVTWEVREGAPYHIGSVSVVGAPQGTEPLLLAMIPFGPGSPLDLQSYRPLRRTMAERLQEEGYGHARVYSRAFVDRGTRSVAWYYYVDAGPRTTVGSIRVEGNHRIPESLIRERVRLAPGDPYSTAAKLRAELALLDTGAFASAVILSNADIQTGPPEHPDTGGVLAPEQVSAEGALVPRHLDDRLEVRVVVVEAPSRQLRAEAGVEGDPTRIDSYAGTRVWLRNAFGAQHHLVLEGNVGYGWRVDGDAGLPAGLYGSALARYLRPGWLGTDLDLRVTGRFRDVLYPTAMLRELTCGPGVRSTLADGVFLDLDVLYRLGLARGFGPFDEMTREELSLPDDDRARGAEVEASIVADRRNDGLEPTRGYLLALRAAAGPGAPLGSHRYAQLLPEARGFVPLAPAWSLAARASAGWVLGASDGAPLGVRLFGGGAYGMRGFGRDRLAPEACAAAPAGTPGAMCDAEIVGGLSLAEASLEARYLPYRKLYGLVAFADAGGAGARANPFADGVATAVGLGGRLRTWYVPVSLDLAYRLVDGNHWVSPGSFDPWLVFFRIGEAF